MLAWAGVVSLAVGFVSKYVLFYYRHYDAASFDTYWPRRFWLFLHINGGTLALLTGPWQFWTGLRRWNMQFIGGQAACSYSESRWVCRGQSVSRSWRLGVGPLKLA